MAPTNNPDPDDDGEPIEIAAPVPKLQVHEHGDGRTSFHSGREGEYIISDLTLDLGGVQ